MTAKNLFFDFLNLVFIIVIVGLSIVYFIMPDRFAAFTEIMRNLAPIAFFVLILLIKIKFNRVEHTKRKNENNTEIILVLNYWDKFISDIIVFTTPILLCLFAYLANQTVGMMDIFYSALIFIIMYFWQRYLFSKQQR